MLDARGAGVNAFHISLVFCRVFEFMFQGHLVHMCHIVNYSNCSMGAWNRCSICK